MDDRQGIATDWAMESIAVTSDSTVPPSTYSGNSAWQTPPLMSETQASPDNSPQPQQSSGSPLPPVAEEVERGFLPVLRNRRFLTLWSGQVFSQLADKVYLVLMIALIASQYQSDDHPITGWVSAIMIAFTIPAVLFGSIAGALVDRWSKKVVLVATNLLRGGLVLILPPCLWLLQDTHPVMGLPLGFVLLIVVTFCVSTLTQFFAPAEQAVIPLIVDRKHLLSANSLYTTTAMASLIVGFAVGEPLLGLADQWLRGLGEGVGKAIVVGVSYSLAGLVLLFLILGHNDIPPKTESPHVWGDIREGLRYLGEKPRIRTAMIQQTLLFSIFAALSVLAVRLAQEIPEIKASQFGFLLAFGGIGMAGGAGFVGGLGHYFSSIQRLNFLGWLGLAGALGGLAFFTHQLTGALLCITLVGFFAALVGVPLQTTIQDETAEEMRGKVFGLQNNGVNIALSLPLALAGVAETFLHLPNVLLGLGGLAIAGAGLNWYISIKGNLKLQHSDSKD
jgi:MFS family permease